MSVIMLALLYSLGWTDTADHLTRGSALFKKGEYDDALKEFSEAIRLAPKAPQGYFERGQVWDAQGDYDKAIGDFNEGLRLAPNFLSGLFHAGAGLGHKGGLRQGHPRLQRSHPP